MEGPTCGKPMWLEERDTSSGSDMRTYRCDQCRQSHDVDRGPALWKMLSDAREAEERSPGTSLAASTGQPAEWVN
jgi:hypothetical protein